MGTRLLLISFILTSCRGETIDQIERSLFRLIEHSSEILANHTQTHQLYSSQEKDDHHEGRVAFDRVTEGVGFESVIGEHDDEVFRPVILEQSTDQCVGVGVVVFDGFARAGELRGGQLKSWGEVFASIDSDPERMADAVDAGEVHHQDLR